MGASATKGAEGQTAIVFLHAVSLLPDTRCFAEPLSPCGVGGECSFERGVQCPPDHRPPPSATQHHLLRPFRHTLLPPGGGAEYRPVAARAATLFFCVGPLSAVDPMYQYSLQWFHNLFAASVGRGPIQRRSRGGGGWMLIKWPRPDLLVKKGYACLSRRHLPFAQPEWGRDSWWRTAVRWQPPWEVVTGEVVTGSCSTEGVTLEVVSGPRLTEVVMCFCEVVGDGWGVLKVSFSHLRCPPPKLVLPD